MKKTLCTRENGTKLKMFRRPKPFDILPDSSFDPERCGDGGGIGLSWESRQKELVFSNQRDR